MNDERSATPQQSVRWVTLGFQRALLRAIHGNMKIAPLTLADGEMRVRMEAWDRRDDAGVRHPCEVLLSVGGDAMIFDDALLTDLERSAYERVLREADSIRERLLDALAKTRSAALANVSPDDIASRVELRAVSIMRVARDGIAYVGYVFDCDWDREHGAGVMTHGERVVEAGAGDTGILSWIAKRDGGSSIANDAPKPAKKSAKKAPKR
jgi:hypothetical protein